ncbi:MAG: PA2169 family four-helix-bundle protein [Burkholderiaceae bacterium]
MDKNDIVSALNNLIQTSRDGDEGFRTASEHVTDPQLKALFANRAASCATSVRELQALVKAQGGEPTDSSSISGALHRRWVDIKAAVTGQSNLAILNEVERGEDVAVASYKKALAMGLPSDVLSVVQRQYEGAQKNHDQIKQLRDQQRAAS